MIDESPTRNPAILQLTRLRPRGIEPTHALGSWCVGIPGAEALPVLAGSREHMNAHEVRQELEQAYGTAIAQVAEWLSDVHGLERDVPYWEFVCYRSVTTLVKEFYLRDRYVTTTVGANPAVLPVTLHPDDFLAPASDIELWTWHANSDLFNLQLLSQAVDGIGSKRLRLRASDFLDAESDPAYSNGKVRNWHRLRRAVHWLRPLVQRRYPPLGPDSIALFPTHFPAGIEARFAETAGLELIRMRFPTLGPRSGRVDRELRRNMKVTVTAGDWTRRLLESIPANLPLDCVEEFPRHRRLAEKLARRGPPRLIVGAYFRGVAERLWIAESRMASHGSRLVIIQHGGGYGEAAGPFVRWADVEMRLADTFVSWGWGAGEPGVVPLSAPRLLKAAHRPREETDTILLVSGPVRRYPTFEHFLGAPTPWQTHERFFGALPAELRRNSVFRGHPHTAGDLEEQAPWSRAYPEVTVDLAEAQLAQLIADARIVVISNPFSTTFLECLSMDRPVIVLSDGCRPEVSDRARHLYQRLGDVGIVFTSAITAATAVARAYADIHRWWGEPDRRAVVEEFTQTFARVASEPVREWAEFLRREAGAQTNDRLSINRAQQL